MKFIVKTIREVDYKDLDEAVNEFLKSKGINKNYNCVAYEEWSNNESHSFDVDSELDDDLLNDLMAGKLHYKTSDILNWMCHEGSIASGEYTINIFW